MHRQTERFSSPGLGGETQSIFCAVWIRGQINRRAFIILKAYYHSRSLFTHKACFFADYGPTLLMYITRAACLGFCSVLPPRLYKGKAQVFNDWSDLTERGQTAVTKQDAQT
jgi:hypothetical protein